MNGSEHPKNVTLETSHEKVSSEAGRDVPARSSVENEFLSEIGRREEEKTHGDSRLREGRQERKIGED